MHCLGNGRRLRVLYFSANDGVHGTELWRSDGTTEGTRLVADIAPGLDSSSPQWPTNVNGVIYFASHRPSPIGGLWRTDGSSEGTIRVSDIYPASYTYDPALVNVSGRLYFIGESFIGENSILNDELWTSDGTAAGTVRVQGVPLKTTGAVVSNLQNVGGTLYFGAFQGTSIVDVWKVDPTNAAAVRVTDTSGEPRTSFPYGWASAGGQVFFVRGSEGDFRIWRIDETAEGGAAPIENLILKTQPLRPEALAELNGTLYFIADDGIHGFELWALKPTPPHSWGNYEFDDTIDGTDVLKWQRAVSHSTIPIGKGSDGDSSGQVDALDLALIELHFGAPDQLPAAGAIAVATTTNNLRDAVFAIGEGIPTTTPRRARPERRTRY